MKLVILVNVALIAVWSSTQVEAKGSKADFEKEALRQHNFYRKRHGVPKLMLDKHLTIRAQKWANFLARSETLQHNDAENQKDMTGENIYMSPNPVTGVDPVVSWYGEFRNYTDYNNDPSITGHPEFRTIGHFTQVVWKNSKKVGIAKATSSRGNTYVVANYSPPGNFQGQYVANVLPPKNT